MSEYQDFPTRSQDGSAALDVFYLDFNDVHFYVEDGDQENLYTEILRRFFPELKFLKIFPLNGKQNVKDHAEDSKNSALIKYPIYLLDKDFDDFLGTIVSDPRIFYLDKYCIENHLIEEDAFVNIVIESNPKLKSATIKAKLSFSSHDSKTIGLLVPLFRLFLCVQRLDLGITNCNCAPETYSVSAKPWQIDSTKISAYNKKVGQAALDKGISPPMVDPLQDARSQANYQLDPHRLISGKFLLALHFHYTKRHYPLGNITFDSFTFRAAKNCSLSSLLPLINRVRVYLGLPAL